MSQAQYGTSNTTPLGVQAAAAASNGSAAKPATETAADTTSDTAASDEKKKSGNKIFIVEGKVHAFDTPAQAEKFLNADDAPTQYAVLRGKQVKSKQKVSLR